MLADGERRSTQLSGDGSILVMLCWPTMACCRRSLLVYQVFFLRSSLLLFFRDEKLCRYSADRRLCYSVIRHCSSFFLPSSGLLPLIAYFQSLAWLLEILFSVDENENLLQTKSQCLFFEASSLIFRESLHILFSFVYHLNNKECSKLCQWLWEQSLK